VNMQASSMSCASATSFLVSDAAAANIDQCMLNLSDVQVQGRNSTIVISQSVMNCSLKAGMQF
jgi:hypothetical protein